MKNILSALIICMLCQHTLSAQTPRGLGMPEDEKPKTDGKTYALIVGISKYQNSGIPGLQYPDKDASVFYEYLKTTGVDTNNMMLLLNDKARAADFWADVNYFLDVTKPGDKLFIYFSGHGDIESRTITRDAYLLPYDAPKITYASGAISIYLLKGYLETLSANGVQVIFISDACHAGNLAGGRAGMEATAAVLKDKWEDEVKILSCQPGEFSLEGKQWGGGRGLFSYELINGLAGKADRNKDGKITLRELNLYLNEKVPDEASPNVQNPVVDGKPDIVLSTANEKELEHINGTEANTLSMVTMRGFDDALLKGVDENIKNNYAAFKACMDTANYAAFPEEQLEKYVFGQSTDDLKILPSALYYLKQIPLNDTTRVLLAFMRRNLSAALMGDLMDSSAVKTVSKVAQGQNAQLIMKQMTNYLKGAQLKAIALEQLLGPERLKKLGIYSKLAITEVYIATEDTAHFDLSFNLALLDSAISGDPNNALLYFWKGMALDVKDKDKEAIEEFRKAAIISPKLTICYSLISLNYKDLNQPDSVAYYGRKIMEYETDDPFMARFGYIQLLDELGTYDSVKTYIADIENYIPPGTPSIQLNNIYIFLGRFARNAHLKDQVVYFMNKISDEHTSIWVQSKYVILADAYADAGDKVQSLNYFKTALDKGWNFFEKIKADKHLQNIRQEPEFKAMMKKHFPEQYKE